MVKGALPAFPCRQNQDEPAQPKHAIDALLQLLRDLIPDNIAAAATDMNILGILFFSVFFGAALSLMGHDEGCNQIMRSVEAFNKIIIKMVSGSEQDLRFVVPPASSSIAKPESPHVMYARQCLSHCYEGQIRVVCLTVLLAFGMAVLQKMQLP